MRHTSSIYIRLFRHALIHISNRALRKIRKVLVETRTGSKLNAPQNNRRPRRSSARPTVTLDEISTRLDELNVANGDTLLVHSGISNLGKLVGGPKPLFEHLCERVGPKGNLLFPTFPFDTLMKTFLDTEPSFDANNTPSKMGALSGIALSHPGRFRSIHPTHSVCGVGPNVQNLLANHHIDSTPFGENSPYAGLVRQGGKILLLGVGLPSVTSFHRTEDRLANSFPVKVYLDGSYDVTCIDADEQIHVVHTPSHDPAISRIRNCNLAGPAMLKNGVYQNLPLGNHHVGVIDAAGMDAILENLLQSERFTIYGRIWG